MAVMFPTLVLPHSHIIFFTHPVLTELPYNGFVQEELDVLHVVESFDGGVTFLGLPPVVGLSRVNSLQDAQSPEVPEGKLELLDSGIPCDVPLGFPGLSLGWKNRLETYDKPGQNELWIN